MTAAELIKKLQAMPPNGTVVWMAPSGKGYTLTGVAGVVVNATTGWTALVSEETRLHMRRKGGR